MTSAEKCVKPEKAGGVLWPVRQRDAEKMEGARRGYDLNFVGCQLYCAGRDGYISSDARDLLNSRETEPAIQIDAKRPGAAGNVHGFAMSKGGSGPFLPLSVGEK